MENNKSKIGIEDWAITNTTLEEVHICLRVIIELFLS
jgi:hypothetical protein